MVSRLIDLWLAEDIGACDLTCQVMIDAGENLMDLIDGVRFMPGTLVRQCPRKIFRLVFRKIVLKDFRKVLLKVRLVVTVIIEVFSQELLQCLKSARSHQTRFQATPAQDLPF